MHTHFFYNGEFTNGTEPVGLVWYLKQQYGCVVLCSTVSPWAFIMSALCCVGCDVQYGTAVVCACIEGCFLDSEVCLVFIWRYHWPDVLVKQVYQC